MDYWFLDNLDKLVPIIIALLYFIGASRAKNKEGEQEGPSPDASERARKIQEEIRRKILERQGKGGRAPSPETAPREPEPVFEPAFEPDPSPFPPRPFQEPVYEQRPESFPEPEPFVFEATDPYEEERRKIEEKLKQARALAKRAESAGKKASVKNRSKDLEGRLASRHKNFILDGLDDTTSIRRAIVLKEVLDTPVGLR